MRAIRLSTQDAIIEAAFQIFNHQPGASLADVAIAAGVSRATLHRIFRTRDDLIKALAHTANAELDAAVDRAVKDAASYFDALRLAMRAIIPLAERQWFLAHEPVSDEPEIAAAFASGDRELEAAIDAAKTEGAITSDMPTRWIALSYENLIYSAWTMLRDGDATADQAALMAWSTFTDGVATQTAEPRK
ncbi:MAG: helix-turn-helix domain-containing protein [Pseudomonadota bacterium]